ncbi:MAG: hypothetical protein WC787_04175 [Patescibacteria group bacterium]|jgi:hypothetical protein
MKNTSYEVLKILHNQMDDLGRIERYCLKDAKDSPCNCSNILKGMRVELKKNIDLLTEELDRHQK